MAAATVPLGPLRKNVCPVRVLGSTAAEKAALGAAREPTFPAPAGGVVWVTMKGAVVNEKLVGASPVPPALRIPALSEAV